MPRLVRIQLGGKERALRYNLTALEALEEDGFSMQELLTDPKQVKKTVTLVWRGLQHAEPHLTREEVAGQLQLAMDNGTTLVEYLTQAMLAWRQSGIFKPEEETVADPPADAAVAAPVEPPVPIASAPSRSGSPRPSRLPTANSA